MAALSTRPTVLPSLLATPTVRAESPSRKTGDQVNAGTYHVTAHYGGDANHEASDGAASLASCHNGVITLPGDTEL